MTGTMKLYNGGKLVTTRMYADKEERDITLSNWRLLAKDFDGDCFIQYQPYIDLRELRKIKLPSPKHRNYYHSDFLEK